MKKTKVANAVTAAGKPPEQAGTGMQHREGQSRAGGRRFKLLTIPLSSGAR